MKSVFSISYHLNCLPHILWPPAPAHLPVKMSPPGRWGAFTGGNLWSWNPPQTPLFKEPSERTLSRFHYVHFILQGASLSTLTYFVRKLGLCLVGSNRLLRVWNEPPHPRPQQQGSAAPASINWTDQTTASLRGSPLRTPCRYCCFCCLSLWPPASLRPALSLPAPDPGSAFEVPGPPERSESSPLPVPHAYTQLL